MTDLFIYNEFGITPTKNFTAAGYDFFIPKIVETEDNIWDILNAFSASYKISEDEIRRVYNRLSSHVIMTHDTDNEVPSKFNNDTSLNILHLYLATNKYKNYTDSSIEKFVENKLIFDRNGVPGIKAELGDYFLFNSGIRVKLNEDTAGVFFNKSGKGNQGFDIRACVVDEDYAGLVHMSAAYDKDRPCEIYCGDKFVQFVILPIVKTNLTEVDKDKFNELHSDSKRGADGFGSSDVKH
jgi:dUTPase